MNNIEVKFYIPGEIPDEKLKYAVIAARYGGGWIFCRHKGRSTWEIPGGHREAGENPAAAVSCGNNNVFQLFVGYLSRIVEFNLKLAHISSHNLFLVKYVSLSIK